LFLKGLKSVDIIQNMNNTLEESTPLNATVYNWIAKFKHDRTNTNDE